MVKLEQIFQEMKCQRKICIILVGHFKEKRGHKYLVLDDVDENKEVLEKYREIWEGVKKEIETINSGEKTEYGKDFEMEMM